MWLINFTFRPLYAPNKIISCVYWIGGRVGPKPFWTFQDKRIRCRCRESNPGRRSPWHLLIPCSRVVQNSAAACSAGLHYARDPVMNILKHVNPTCNLTSCFFNIHLRHVLPSALIPSGFPTKILYVSRPPFVSMTSTVGTATAMYNEQALPQVRITFGLQTKEKEGGWICTRKCFVS
jgi:hypothetical protein